MGKIQIVVFGYRGEQVLIDLCDTEEMKGITVLQLKQKISEQIPANPGVEMRLIHIDMLLEDSSLLSSYGIQHMSTVHMILRLPGGGGPVEEQP